MENDTMHESVSAGTKLLWVHGRSLWNQADGSLSFDWSGTQIIFRVLGSPAEVNMLASIGQDVLAVHADGCLVRKIGPGSGMKETFLLVSHAPEDCRISIVKLSEPNMSNPITIYDIWTGPSFLQDEVTPSICPLDFSRDRLDAGSTFECVGDSDTSALYNVAISDSAKSLDSNIEEGWPFFLAESLGVAPPTVVALSGVGVLSGPHRPETLSDYYPRPVCCWKDSQNNAQRDSISAGSPQGPLCVLVFVGGNDFVTMPRNPPSAQSLFLKGFVSAHQALLNSIRQRRPSSPIVCLYGDADSCSGCQSAGERKFISSCMQTAVLESVAGLGGAPYGFFSCLVQPNIRPQCRSDWSHDMHWSPTGQQKFATGLKKALLALALREGVQCPGFQGMVNLATMLSAGVRPQSWSPLHFRAMAGDTKATALLVEDERCLGAVDSAAMTSGKTILAKVTPLHLAACAGHLSVTGALLGSQAFAPFVNSFAQEGTSTHSQWSALHVAAVKGHADVAKCLLHSQTFSTNLINAVTGSGSTALHLACFAGNQEVIQLLLDEDRFTAVDATTAKGCTALHLACSAGNAEVVQLLLDEDRFTAVDAATAKGYTALHEACFAGNAEVVQLLLDEDRFTAVNAATACDSEFEGHTALTIAIRKGHESIACLLLRHRRFHAVDALCQRQQLQGGLEPLDALQLMALQGMRKAVQLHLDMHACRKPAAFVRVGAVLNAAFRGHESTVHVLTAHAAVDTPAELAHTPLDESGFAPNALHVACHWDHMGVVQCILRLNGCEGAINSNNGTTERATALHIAAYNGHEDIALCLLQSDSFTAVNAVQATQKTALHVACEGKFERIAVDIIEHPKFNKHHAVCSSGKTALMVAKKLKLHSVIDALARI